MHLASPYTHALFSVKGTYLSANSRLWQLHWQTSRRTCLKLLPRGAHNRPGGSCRSNSRGEARYRRSQYSVSAEARSIVDTFNIPLRVQKDGPTDFTLLIASTNVSSETHEFEIGNNKGKLTVQYGDYSADLAKVNEALTHVSRTCFVDQLAMDDVLTIALRQRSSRRMSTKLL